MRDRWPKARRSSTPNQRWPVSYTHLDVYKRQEVVRAGGGAFLRRLLDRNAAIAAAPGHPMRDAFISEYRALVAAPATAYGTSMLRDIEAGGRIEADHILGFLLEAARRAGIPEEAHEAALLHARAYEQRRAAGRLPRG